ncbi:MAG TPA: ATP-binding cassette domain-containing protein [Anaerolineaceae bacterium]|jgi:ABC-2 type transport system ATP-binding protein|nr:ATP-binding cassette domain-containing protein [Anaerolineaceae bacterium]
MSTPIIRVTNLVKLFKVPIREKRGLAAIRSFFYRRFRTVRAVDEVSFSLEPGELVGYLGPNGAGKSTTIKMLTGLLVPTSGELSVAGFTPWKQRAAYVANLGAVFGQRVTLWWDLPVLDSYDLIRAMYRIPADRYQQNLKAFRELLELDEFIQSPVRALSLGQRMRAELCGALLHDPRLVFLDEPTIGLDVVAKERIRQFIQHIHRERGTTIILTTHDLADVERLCHRVIILDVGRILYDGDLGRLAQRFEGPHELRIAIAEDGPAVLLPGLPPPRRDGRFLVYAFDPRQTPVAGLLQQLNGQAAFTDLEVHRPPLEDTIRRIYEQRLLLPDGPAD